MHQPGNPFYKYQGHLNSMKIENHQSINQKS